MTTASRPVPVPDEQSAPFWQRRPTHVLVLARCSRCGQLSHPPDLVMPPLRLNRSGLRLHPGRRQLAPIRSWTVVRQSFLPGFRRPPVRPGRRGVAAQAELRLIGRLLDGPDAGLSVGSPVSLAFEDIAPASPCPPSTLAPSSRERADGGQQPGRHRRVRPEPGRAPRRPAPRRPDRGDGPAGHRRCRAELAQVDGFVTGSLFPTAGAHAAEDGVSLVSANWLAEHLGINPSYAAGFQGFGQIPGAVSLAVNAVASGAADYVLVHRALHNPQRQLPRQPDARGPRVPAVDGAPGLLRSAGHDRPRLQRVPPTVRGDPGGHGRVVAEARKNGARIPWSYWSRKPLSAEEYLAAPMINDPICRFDCDIPVDGVAAFVFTSAERARDLPQRPVYVAGYATGRPGHASPAVALAPRRHHGGRGGDGPPAVGALRRRPAEVDLPQVYDGFSPFVYFWMESLGFCRSARPTAALGQAASTATDPGRLPVLSGGGALGNGRMHGVPQMLECYLQLSGRAGERQRARTLRSAWPATPLPTSAARSSTAPSRFDPPATARGGASDIRTAGEAAVSQMTWAERAAERSPMVQRSRSRGVEQARTIVEAAQRLIEPRVRASRPRS